jgi:Glycosyltransferase family 28 N-terminal domain
MKLAMIAFGTRGDVQPAVALGKALKAEGHSVLILAGVNFKDWIEGHGLEAVASTIDIQSVMESDLGRDWIEKGGNPLTQMRLIKRLTDETGWETMTDAWSACRDADAIFSSFTSDIYAVSIAEKLGVRHTSVPLQPVLFPTRSGAATINAPMPDRGTLFTGSKRLRTNGSTACCGCGASRWSGKHRGKPPRGAAHGDCSAPGRSTFLGPASLGAWGRPKAHPPQQTDVIWSRRRYRSGHDRSANETASGRAGRKDSRRFRHFACGRNHRTVSPRKVKFFCPWCGRPLSKGRYRRRSRHRWSRQSR